MDIGAILAGLISSDWVQVILGAVLGAGAVVAWLRGHGETTGYWLGRATKGEAVDRALDEFLSGFLRGLRKTYTDATIEVDRKTGELAKIEADARTIFKVAVKDTDPFGVPKDSSR